MPSPFKRHGASRQIQPMSRAELDASLAELEAKEAEDTSAEGIGIRQLPNGNWITEPTLRTGRRLYGPQYVLSESLGENAGMTDKARIDEYAQALAKQHNVPYLGER